MQNFLKSLIRITLLVGIFLTCFFYGPGIIDWLNSKLNTSITESYTPTIPTETSSYQPAFNPRLSKTNHLVIPSIGVDTDLEEATYDSYEIALKKGVWRVSDFGSPEVSGVPTILAAHRFGYLAWSNKYRRENSFYNLPNLKVGDIVEIIWHQRKYTYEIYADGKGPNITDYSANLILYTCENLVGSTRFFKYARLLEL
ncbi:MAG TPA: sortase [Alphaproteobacteria bacterium]|jgi:sortase (surface protein transpeptidase)|nr:sortase [Alphaproteobacteria bacterium]